MARLLSIGFELNSATEISSSTAGGTATIQTATVRTGTYALGVNLAVSGGTRQIIGSFQTSAIGGVFFARVYFNYTTAPPADNAFFGLFGTISTTSGVTIKVSSTGTLKLFNGTTQIGSASSALTAGTWYMIELQSNSTGGAGASILEARLNGVVFATSSTVTLVGTRNFVMGQNLYSEAATTGVWFMDDACINNNSGSFQNTYPGSGSIAYLEPSGAGDSTQWTIAGSSPAATNWQSVSDIPPDDAVTLVNESVLNKSDFYTVTTSPLGASDTVNVVQVGARFNNDVADATSRFQVQIEKTSAGTVTKSTAIIPNSITFAYNGTAAPLLYPVTLYNDPDGSAWTQTTINSMQIGMLAGTVGTHKVQVTALWALVEYIPATVITGYPAGLFGGSYFAQSYFADAWGGLGNAAVSQVYELALVGVG